MVLARHGPQQHAVRAMPQFLSAGAWDEAPIRCRHGQAVERDRGDDQGVVLLAGRDVPTPGPKSVGVTRQDGGALGTRANGHAGGFLGYASHPGYPLVDRRLSVPQAWLEDEAEAERRQACGIPEGVAFTPQPRRGWTLLQAVHPADGRRCRGVACDEALGRETTRRDHSAGVGLWYDAEVPHDTRGGRARPATAVPGWSGRGRQPTRARVVAGAGEPHAGAVIAAAMPASAGSQQTIQAGSQGPRVADFATLRVITGRDGWPGPEVWLLLRRHPLTGALHTSRSHASQGTPLASLVRMRGRRWPMAPCVEDGKQYLGRGDDDVRSWPGGHHHRTLCILDHGFLVRLQCRFKKTPRA